MGISKSAGKHSVPEAGDSIDRTIARIIGIEISLGEIIHIFEDNSCIICYQVRPPYYEEYSGEQHRSDDFRYILSILCRVRQFTDLIIIIRQLGTPDTMEIRQAAVP